ncbi:MAG TPA: DUF4438 domain-containing protein [bacterium]|jgi:hypothetical protein|nr:DUF4438 domain-containing protein [bacterium]HOL55298.1 DUF4438 domain-containing protein [bacterium]HPO82573.1 DUF4438 domain-containing protein [bacterium]HRR91009.1 DUF4438 domain-containing protein [bacterium]HRU32981.1 DUF4438 domain-containing protein [bacterium]
MRLNLERLVKLSVWGDISSPTIVSPYRVNSSGKGLVLPTLGGITYNIRVGDPALGWAGDHVEPGVSLRNKDRDESNALNILSCIGNRARVISGDAKGEIGIVTGKHGGIEHVLIDFPERVLERLNIGDKIQIESYGQGMEILNFPEIKVMNISPDLFSLLNIKEDNNGLKIGVRKVIPAELMGSGIGSASSFSGDYDIMTQDRETLRELGLEDLKLGDIVGIKDMDDRYGRTYKKGARSVGVVIHCDCVQSGHGPGVTVVLSSSDNSLEFFEDGKANIAHILKIGRYGDG